MWILAAASLIGSLSLLAATAATVRFCRRARPSPSSLPPVTLLKPLCGDEPGLYENLLSFCTQDYPEVQLVFGVQNPSDPAIGVVRRLMAALPQAAIDLVVDGTRHGSNRKVSNLLNMMGVARHDILVVADSDMAAEPLYLRTIVAGLEQPGVGLVTCLYRGIPAVAGLWPRLGALWINAGFLPSVLLGRHLRADEGCFGATMALRRETLVRLGGFERFKDRLADDYLLGEAVRGLGLTVELAPVLVDTTVTESSFRALLSHELRWTRTIATIAGPRFAASVITHPVVLALLAVAVSPGPAAWTALAVAATARLWMVFRVEGALGLDHGPVWLILPRDILSFAALLGAYSGRSVTWRNEAFEVRSDGYMVAEEGSR